MGQGGEPLTDADMRELTPRVKAAKVARLLALGATMTTAEVAQETGLDRSNAWRLMCAMSQELPITSTVWGVWYDQGAFHKDGMNVRYEE